MEARRLWSDLKRLDTADLSALVPIFRRGDIGPAVKLCYLYLWMRVGCGEGVIAGISYHDLGGAFTKSHTAARKWLATLIAEGLVAILDDRGGILRLAVYAPPPDDGPSRRLIVSDGQSELFDHGETFSSQNVSGRKDESLQGDQPQEVGSDPMPVAGNVGDAKRFVPIETRKERNKSTHKTQGKQSPTDNVQCAERLHVSHALAGSLAQRLADQTEPDVRWQRLHDDILHHLPGVADWLSSRASDAVVYHGLPESKLKQAIRTAKKAHTNPAGLFKQRMADFSAEFGIDFGQNLRPEREGEA